MCQSDIGPCFEGGDSSELSATGKALYGDYGYCHSSANMPGYRIPLDGAGKNMLTNTKDEDSIFTITELEVWEVKYLE